MFKLMPTNIQDEPESTIGKKPIKTPHDVAGSAVPTRSGASIRREEGDENEAGSEIRDRDPREPPPISAR